MTIRRPTELLPLDEAAQRRSEACVLVPIRLATTLLWLAEAGLFQPMWSETILGEVQRHLPDVGVAPERATHRVETMRHAFGDEAMIDDFDPLIERMTCDAKDRHVLAAAVHGGSDTLVTFNLKDFPDRATAPYGVGLRHPDRFLVDLLDTDADTVMATLKRETAAFRPQHHPSQPQQGRPVHRRPHPPAPPTCSSA